MTEEEKWVKRLPRWTYESAVSQFKPVAPMPPNTLTNADGTPYSAGYDTKSPGQIAYEAYVENGSHRDKAHAQPWDMLFRVEQDMWEKVAQAVLQSQ